MDFMEELLYEAGKKHKDFTKLKMKLCKKHGIQKIPTNIEILLNAPPDKYHKLKSLMTKPTRTLSGVAVVAIMTRPAACPHGKCTTCPGGPDSVFGDVPQSYTGKEPATRRAIRNKFDPYLQVMNRLEQYIGTGHVPEKIELIIMGGTFPARTKAYRESFVTGAFAAMNDFSRMFFPKGELDLVKFKMFFELPGDLYDKGRERRIEKRLLALKKKRSLEREHKKNEEAKVRCVSLVIETRPDHAKKRHALEMLRLGCTKVELGVQSVYDKALRSINRGHTVDDSVRATKVLKDLGFKVNYHMMPGLPGVSLKEDKAALNTLFSDPDFRPDMLKIYPCMVMKGTKLYEVYKKGKYKPLSTKQAARLMIDFKQKVPEYVRIMRVQRDIPTFMTEAGVDMTNLRQHIKNMMDEKGIRCNCIRCREVGRRGGKGRIGVKVLWYEASSGDEFFISAENDSLIGFSRMRFPADTLSESIDKDTALIRELHVYGEAASIGEKGKSQHRGWGKRLLNHAEKLAKQNGKKRIVVISGVGVRGYYRKLGYRRQGPYMVKLL